MGDIVHVIFKCSVFVPFVCNQVKNAGRKLGRRCDMCSNYEKQLQSIQGQEAETRDQVSFWAAFFTAVASIKVRCAFKSELSVAY